MAQVFVYNGLQFTTTSVTGSVFGGSATQGVDAIRLEDVVAAVSPTAATTAIIPGANAAAQLITLTSWWEPGPATDSYLKLQRELIDNATSGVIAGSCTWIRSR